MNLHGIVTPAISAINPPLVGSVRVSTGSVEAGDATFTASITGAVMTVSAVASGALAPDSVLVGAQGSILAQLTGPAGGVGTYQISQAQTFTSTALSCVGAGTRVPTYAQADGVSMQVQALTGREIQHLDSLNIQGLMRGVYMNGNIQGLVRAAGRGGDVLLLPTGLSGAMLDTWLVVAVLETWDTDGWCKVAVALQNPPQDQ